MLDILCITVIGIMITLLLIIHVEHFFFFFFLKIETIASDDSHWL